MRRILIIIAGLAILASPARAQTTAALLDSLQLGAFRYAWYEANPLNGLIKDRSAITSPASIAATGFGLSAICVGVEHGWVSRPTAAARVLLTLQTFWNKPQGPDVINGSTYIGYHGLFYHFLDMSTGLRTWDSELSTIDTALLLAGILDARQYFDGGDATETEIRSLANSIYQRVEWTFLEDPVTHGIKMGWHPDGRFYGNWIGYNEAMIMYILAFGSPTHPISNPTAAWTTWTSGYQYQTQFGQTYVIFPPLFGHQYSHCWIDFRRIKDAYMTTKGFTYFENSRRATLAQKAYAIAKGISSPSFGYTDSLWGLTASDDPLYGYLAHGAPPAQNDNGTITPTAPISSIPFAPADVIPVIHKLWNLTLTNPDLADLWGFYGPKDAFNFLTTPDWNSNDVLGIDQGPIIMMIENYKSGAVWNRFMQAPEVQLGLQRAGFSAPTAVEPDDPGPRVELLSAGPNPFGTRATLRYQLPRPGRVRLAVFDVSGRAVARLVDGEQEAGLHAATLEAARLPSGVYRLRLESDGQVIERNLVRLR